MDAAAAGPGLYDDARRGAAVLERAKLAVIGVAFALGDHLGEVLGGGDLLGGGECQGVG